MMVVPLFSLASNYKYKYKKDCSYLPIYKTKINQTLNFPGHRSGQIRYFSFTNIDQPELSKGGAKTIEKITDMNEKRCK